MELSDFMEQVYKGLDSIQGQDLERISYILKTAIASERPLSVIEMAQIASSINFDLPTLFDSWNEDEGSQFNEDYARMTEQIEGILAELEKLHFSDNPFKASSVKEFLCTRAC